VPIRPERKNFYPPDWNQISARIRFVRANYMCECTGECGKDHTDMETDDAFSGWLRNENAEPVKGRCTAIHAKPHPETGSKVILTTAHLNHREEECNDENLKAMCNGCHLRYDAEHHAQTRRRNHDLQNGMLSMFDDVGL
jgi:hypothetical protein